MFEKVKVSPTKDNKYIILKDIQYKHIVIPKGYKTNGADVPRLFWNIIPPFKPKYLPAVVVHDYLCSKKLYLTADMFFEDILFSIEKSIKTKAMVMAVKIYHKLKYKV